MGVYVDKTENTDIKQSEILAYVNMEQSGWMQRDEVNKNSNLGEQISSGADNLAFSHTEQDTRYKQNTSDYEEEKANKGAVFDTKTKSYGSNAFYHNQILSNDKSYINPSKEQNKKSINIEEEFYSSEFLEFWKNYPKLEGKQVVFLEFKKLNKYEQEMAIKTALMYAKDKETIEAKYIKNASNWLRDRCFEDYGLEEVNKVNEKINFIENLNKKIIALFKENLDLNKPFFEQENSLGIVFCKNEKYILKQLDFVLDDYKNLEFQDGKLLSFLKTIIE